MGIFLGKATWPEVKKYTLKNDIVLIPTGSCEQHGYHLPIGTDYMVAEEISNRVGEKNDVLVCPTFPAGHSSNHERFPGTLSIKPINYRGFMEDICRSLLFHGLRKIIFINGHSGNTPLLQEICNILQDEKAVGFIIDWWELAGMILPEDALSGHGDSLEASAIMAFSPDLVKKTTKQYHAKKLTSEILVESWQKVKFKEGHIYTWLKTEVGSETGHFGSLSDISSERGERVISAVVEYVSDFIREVKKIKIKKGKF